MKTTRPEPGTCSEKTVAAENLSVARRFGPPTIWLDGLVALLVLWYERARQRSRLAELDDHLLQDIGKTREQALVEAGKPFWQP